MQTIFEHCSKPEKRLRASFPGCKSIPATAQTQVIRTIHDRLSRPQPQPIEIGYCSSVLALGRAYEGRNRVVDAARDLPEKLAGLVRSSDDHSDVAPAQCGLHSSLVIGRRKNSFTGRCQLLVRNSHGRDCDSYSKDWGCDFGNIWVDEDILAQSIFSMSYLE